MGQRKLFDFGEESIPERDAGAARGQAQGERAPAAVKPITPNSEACSDMGSGWTILAQQRFAGVRRQRRGKRGASGGERQHGERRLNSTRRRKGTVRIEELLRA